jgi:hypothetical protein
VSRWLERALAELRTEALVPDVPKSPKSAAVIDFGDFDHFGTGAVSPEDWQAYFDERAAIREYEGQLRRAEAEALAFEDTVRAVGRSQPGLAEQAKLPHDFEISQR